MPFTTAAIAPLAGSPASSLADVLAQVREAFSAMGDATPIMCGAHYLSAENPGAIGAAPRVLFVPEPKGKAGPPIEMGNVCSITSSCDVYVRAAEGGDDFGRLTAAYALLARVLGCLSVAGTGRTEFGSFADDSPDDVDAYGADLTVSFTYQWDVPHDAARWALAPAAANTDTPRGIPPQGRPFTITSITPVAVPQEA